MVNGLYCRRKRRRRRDSKGGIAKPVMAIQKTILSENQIIYLTFKRIKNMYLRVLPPDGRVCVSVPLGTGEARIAAFVRERRAWIDQRRVLCIIPTVRYETGDRLPLWGERLTLTRCSGPCGVRRVPDGLLLSAPADADEQTRMRILKEFYRVELKLAVQSMLEECENACGVKANEWRIRDMTSRWGSCNVVDRRIWLNLRLAEYPPECLRYVIFHELCHLRERGHGKAFWSLMDGCCPDWRRMRKRLNGGAAPDSRELERDGAV